MGKRNKRKGVSQLKRNAAVVASNPSQSDTIMAAPIPCPGPGMLSGKKRTGAMVLLITNDFIFMVHDSLFSCTDIFTGKVEHQWTLPGGARNGIAESLAMCASRELLEESRGLLFIPPPFFEQCELIGACHDIETHDGLRRVYALKLVGEMFDVSLFDRRRKPNASFNETGDCCLIKRVDFQTASYSLSADGIVHRVTNGAGGEASSPLTIEQITRRAVNAIGSFARGEPFLSIAVSKTCKQSCLPLLGRMGYTKYDLSEVEVRFIATGYVETLPLRRLHTGLFNADGLPADEAYGARPSCWSCCGREGFDAAPCELV